MPDRTPAGLPYPIPTDQVAGLPATFRELVENLEAPSWSGYSGELGFATRNFGLTVNARDYMYPTTVLSVDVTTNGGPVVVEFLASAVDIQTDVAVDLYRDDAALHTLYNTYINTEHPGHGVAISAAYRDHPPAGPHTYSVRAHAGTPPVMFRSNANTPGPGIAVCQLRVLSVPFPRP